MTLYKKIASFIALAFMLLFVLVVHDNVKQSGVFLSEQMQASAQDMATVIGISISTTNSGKDIAALDTLFNAVFDSGYYSRIRLLAMDNSVIHQKDRALSVQGVPDWFVKAVPLHTVEGRAQVMDGWSPLGTVELILHPGFAYINLYDNLLTSLLLFFVLFLMILLLLWYVLHIVLKPLRAINQQANAIYENDFIQQEHIPNTVEFRQVVKTMNRLVTKFQQNFIEQEKTLERYNELLYVDASTGLYNRRFMLVELEKNLSESVLGSAYLLILKIQELEAIRDYAGYGMVDDLVEALSEVIRQQIGNIDNNKYARMKDNEIALLLPVNKSSVDLFVNKLLEIVREKFCEIAINLNKHQPSLSVGIVNVQNSGNVSELLAEVDLALAQAETGGIYQYHYAALKDLQLPQGKMQWRSFLQQALDEKQFYLVSQSVLDHKYNIIQNEVFVRLNDEQGQVISAAIFIPMAVSLGYGLDIDHTVFDLLERLECDHKSDVPYAFNLSDTFFNRVGAFDTLKHFMQNSAKKSIKLCVETTHIVLQQYPDICMRIAALTKQSGQQFGIDNFDLHNSVKILKEIRPDYIKINARVLDDISGHEASAAYQALRTLTKTLDIQLIAVGVDTQTLYDRLIELSIDAVQGNLLDKPKEIK